MILQRTLDTYCGLYDFAVTGGAIGSYDLQVPIPAKNVVIEFGVITLNTLTSGGLATVSFDYLDVSIPIPTIVGTALPATALANFVIPSVTNYGTLPSSAPPSSPQSYQGALTILMHIGVADLLSGRLMFYARTISFDLA